MPKIIANSAGLARIAAHVREAYATARKHGGQVAAAAEEHLAIPVADMGTTEATAIVSAAAEMEANAVVVAALAQCHTVIAGISDEMWNALGRPPALDSHMTTVFPGGLTTSRTDDSYTQPLMMSMLEARILACNSAAAWPEDRRREWAARIAAPRVVLDAAVKVHGPLHAEDTLARAHRRATVHRGLDALRSFKGGLLNLGLTNAQIFQIIPDGTPKRAAPKTTEDGAAHESGDGSPGPKSV